MQCEVLSSTRTLLGHDLYVAEAERLSVAHLSRSVSRRGTISLHTPANPASMELWNDSESQL